MEIYLFEVAVLKRLKTLLRKQLYLIFVLVMLKAKRMQSYKENVLSQVLKICTFRISL